MGRGSDTRMYSPRSESTRMFGYDEDEDDIGHAHGHGDPELSAEERENKKRKKEKTKQQQKLHHLQVKHKDILDEMPDGMGEVLQEGDNELAPKDEEQKELSDLTGASGSRGAMVDQAVGAKTGTGSALGGTPPLLGAMGVYHSEPMDSAWSSLMKAKKDKHEGPIAGGEIGTAGTTTERRKEHAKKWAQPKFPIAPGGRRPWTATSRRSKARSRTLAPRHRVHNIKGGLMQQPLAVHMSHLGVQTKQPLRQFPAKYRQYYGQQLRRRLTGNIAQTVAPHGMMGERTQSPGPTGGGRLPGLLPGQAAAARMPSLNRLARPRAPRLQRPTGFSAMTPPTIPSAPSLPQPAQMGLPSSNIQMSGKVGVGSPLKKNLDILRPGTFAFAHSREIALLLRQLKEQLERRERTRKGDAGEDKPDYPANSPKKTTKPSATGYGKVDDDPRYWGMEPSAQVGNH